MWAGFLKSFALLMFSWLQRSARCDQAGQFPRVEGEAEIFRPEKVLSMHRESETILLVEDNEPLREVTREMLKGLGYAVLDSGRPSEAIRTAERHDGPIALQSLADH